MILISLPLLLPVALLAVLWIKLVSPKGSVLFRQERIGRGGRKFTIFKFRSMHAGASTKFHETYVKQLMRNGGKLEKLDARDPRLIRGAWLLRMSGIDELPQIINVLRGDMSIVGPRPCIPGEFAQYDPSQRRRFTVHPGLTGYWQVNGKTKVTFERMLELDEYYVAHRSLRLDLWILLVTPFAVCKMVGESVQTRLRERLSRRIPATPEPDAYATVGDSGSVTRKLTD